MTFDAPQARDLLDQYWRGKETDDGLAHAVTAALAEIEQLRNALKPFAETWTAAGARVDLCATADDITDQAAAALTSFHFIKACAALEASAAPEPTVTVAADQAARPDLPEAADMSGCSRVWFGVDELGKAWWRLDAIMDGAESASYAFLPNTALTGGNANG